MGFFCRSSGVLWLDVVVCYLWHSQFLYWSLMFVSIWNLTLVGIERYITVCYPMQKHIITKKALYIAFLCLYVCGIMVLWGVYFSLYLHFHNGKCQAQNDISGKTNSTFSFIVL